MNQMISEQVNSNTLMNAGQSTVQGQIAENVGSIRT
jgi:hypothetical protein